MVFEFKNNIAFLLVLFCLGIPQKLKATHILGGELTYIQTDTNRYDVYLTMYIDCGPTNTVETGLWDVAELNVWDNIQATPIATFINTNLIEDSVLNTYTNPCAVLPPDLCVKRGEYYFDVIVPPNSGDFTFTYQLCCFNENTTNSSMTQGLTVYCLVTPEENNSPTFNSQPSLGSCMYDDLNLDLSMNDPDGDSLVYSFFTPFATSDPTSVFDISPPPFVEYVWEVGYDVLSPMSTTNGIFLDSITGALSGSPTQIGNYVVGIKIEEYRGGVKIGEYMRVYRYLITDCSLGAALLEISVDQYCDDLDYQFINNSVNGNGYYWNFGDPSSGINDTSSLVNPSHIYPDYGTYTVLLIAYNNVLACSDTLTYDLEVLEVQDFTYNHVGKYCLDDNIYEFTPSLLDVGLSYFWDFGPNAIPANSTEMKPENIHFTSKESQEVSLTIFFANCKKTYKDSLFIDYIIDNIEGPQEVCLYETVVYSSSPGVNYPRNYSWVINNQEFITETASIQFEDTGLYDISLDIYDPIKDCHEEILLENWLRVYPLPTPDFTLKNFDIPVNEEIFLTDLSLNSQSTYWVISNGDTVYGDDPVYTFLNEGTYTITQFSSDELCSDQITKSVIVSPHKLIYPNAFSPNGDNLNEGFIPKGRTLDDITFYRLKIHDRWGRLLFTTNDPFHPWFGIDKNGNDVGTGMYIWTAEYTTHAVKRELMNTVLLLE